MITTTSRLLHKKIFTKHTIRTARYFSVSQLEFLNKMCYYDVLGLHVECSYNDISERHSFFSSQFHESRYAKPNHSLIMDKVDEAHRVLSFEEEREEYDSFLEGDLRDLELDKEVPVAKLSEKEV